MTLSKGAVGNLMNRYRAVLKKCHLMNMFGSLAVAGLLVAGSAVSATANENTATAIAGEGKPVVVDKGVINGRVIGGSAAEGNSAVINGDTSLTFTGGMLNGEIFGGGLAAGGGADASVTGTATINITGGTFKPMEKDVQADHGRIYIRGAGGAFDGGTASVRNVVMNITGGIFDPSANGNPGRVEIYGAGVSDNLSPGSKVAVKNVEINISGVDLGETNGDAWVYGGGDGSGTFAEQSTITIKDATVDRVYGGGWGGSSVGSVNINIIDSEVDHLYGGGDSDKDADAPDPYTTTIGKASIVLSGSSRVNGDVYGGGNTGGEGNKAVFEETSVTISGGTFGEGDESGNIYGGGRVVDGASEKINATHVIISGDASIKGDVYGGGRAEGRLAETSFSEVGTASLTIAGGRIEGAVYGGGDAWEAVSKVGTATTLVSGGKLLSDIYAGGNGKGTSVETAHLTLSGGEVSGCVFGGGDGDGQGAAGTVHSSTVLLKDGVRILRGENGGGIVYGGGNGDKGDIDDSGVTFNVDNTTVRVEGGLIQGDVYAGGKKNSSTGTADVILSGGEIGGNVYAGGGAGDTTGATNDAATVKTGTITVDTDSLNVGGKLLGGNAETSNLSLTSKVTRLNGTKFGGFDFLKAEGTTSVIGGFTDANVGTSLTLNGKGTLIAPSIQLETGKLTLADGTLQTMSAQAFKQGLGDAGEAAATNGIATGLALTGGTLALQDASYNMKYVVDAEKVIADADGHTRLAMLGTLKSGNLVFGSQGKGEDVGNAEEVPSTSVSLGKIDLVGGDTIMINSGQAITIRGDGEKLITSDSGDVKLLVGSKDNGAGTLNLGDAGLTSGGSLDGTLSIADESTVNVRAGMFSISTMEGTSSSAITIGTAQNAGGLTVGKASLNGANVFLDPAWKDGGNLVSDASIGVFESFANGAVDGRFAVGRNSLLVLGDKDSAWAQKAVQDALDNADLTWGKDSVTAALAIKSSQKLSATGALLVDGSLATAPSVTENTATFAGQSLLVVNAAAADGEGALQGDGTSRLSVDGGAKLHIMDVKGSQEYTVTSGFVNDKIEGWQGDDLIVSRLFNAAVNTDGGKFVVKTEAKRPDEFSQYAIPNILAAIASGNVNNPDAAGVRFLSGLMDSELSDRQVRVTADSAAQLAYAGGVQASAIAVAQAPARALQEHLSLAGSVAQKGTNLHEDGFDLWANAIYGANRTRDFSAGGLDAGYNTDFAGGVIGGDWTFDAGVGKGRVGLALNVGAGDTKSRGDFNSTKNDFDFWGVSVYGGWSMDNINVVADLGYSASKNELKQDIPSSLGMGGKIKADVDSDVITAGVKAEYMVKTDVLDVMPHVGVRYMAVKTDSFSTKLDQDGDLFRTDGDLQHVWQFPVGVNLSKSFETESGWKIKPQADLSVVPAAGDTKTKIDVRTPGVNASDSMKRRVMDTTAFDGVFGVELQKDNVSFGLGYNVQASEHQTGQGVTASFMYKF